MVGLQTLAAGIHRTHFFTRRFQPLDAAVEQKFHPRLRTQFSQTGGKQLAIAGAVFRQMQSAGQFIDHARQRRFVLQTFLRRQFAERHAVFGQHRHILLRRIHFFLLAENLQSAFVAAFKRQINLALHTGEHLAAVFRNPHHPLFVAGIVFDRTVLQHFQQPLQLIQRAVRAQNQRRMRLGHPFERFLRNTWRRPRRGIAVR